MDFDSNELYSNITEQMDETQQANLDQLLKVTNDMIFKDPETNTLIDHLSTSQNIGKDLGEGAFHFFLSLMQDSKNMPGDIVDPYAMIMIARVCEYLEETGIEIEEEDYETAVQTFITLVHNKFDPEFQGQMQQRGFGQQQAQPIPEEAAQPQAGMLGAP